MTIFDSIILGIVEGLTEFLPVSSTGHMILVSSLMKLAETDFLKTFEISIQLGAILAVVFLYYKKFFDIKLLTNLAIAFVPTGLIGLFLYKYIKVWLGDPMIVIYSLFIGGIVILLTEKWYATKKEEIDSTEIRNFSYKESFYLGLCQAVSMIPGVSRSGAIIIGGLLIKMRRDILTEFTFLLAVPTMFVATLISPKLKVVADITLSFCMLSTNVVKSTVTS